MSMIEGSSRKFKAKCWSSSAVWGLDVEFGCSYWLAACKWGL